MTGAIKIKEPGAPATWPQVKFLAFLLETRPFDCQPHANARFAVQGGMLNKGVASGLIDALKSVGKIKWPDVKNTVMIKDEKIVKIEKGGVTAAVAAPVADSNVGWNAPVPVKAPGPAPVPVETPTPDYGYYEVPSPSGAQVLYSWNKVKKNHVTIPKIHKLAIVKKWDGTVSGKWVYQGGTYAAKKLLAGQTPLTLDQASKLGKQFGVCIRCGRTLTDPVSVANGIGPVCAGYWGVGA